jgi:Ala-tRNA(Pro) deacylase
MNLREYLDEQGVQYKLSHHPPVYSAQELAAVEHLPGMQVIKPVVVRADGEYVMCVLPASYRLDMSELRNQLHADDVKIAEEQALQRLFPGCELGAEPPIGRLFGIPTVMDESLTRDDVVTFQAGTHQDAVTMSLAEYRRVAQPEMAHFGRHA